MDHKQFISDTGSPLWEHLTWLFNKGKSTSLDPMPIRNLIIGKEKQRILKDEIAPMNRLFDLGHREFTEERNILIYPSSLQRIGQQDCKDLFICIGENREHWSDVFSLFKIETFSSTTCLSCFNLSEQNQCTPESIFLVFDCPEKDMPMSALIEENICQSVQVDNWKDEDGCQKITVGENRTRIRDIKNTEFLIFILNRLIRIDDQLQIVDRKVPLGGDVSLEDTSGHIAVFSPIAVIHHSGVVVGDTTIGHYQADVLDNVSCNWIRTSDDQPPAEVAESDLTDQGYIFLYKKQQ